MPLQLVVDLECQQLRRGVALHRDLWTGWRVGEPRAVLCGHEPFERCWRDRLRNALVLRMSHLDTLRLGEPEMERFALRVLRQRPTLLFGQSHSLYLFARFWEDRKLPPHRFRAALSTAMVLRRHERETIARVFATEVFDRYGSEEMSLVATECEAHEGLHVNSDALIVEVSPGNGPAGEGRILVTDLWNRGMPFIRYELGDHVVPSSRACSCGRTYPLLERIVGRVADHLWRPDGVCVSGIPLTENFARLFPDVQHVQIVQDRLDHLLVRIVPGSGFGAQTRRLVADLVREFFGPDMQHSIRSVDRIPQEPSGKYRFAICAIPGGDERRAQETVPRSASTRAAGRL